MRWNSKKTQLVRFDNLLSLLPGDLREKTLCDAGCGFGDLHGYLAKKGLLPREYTGIDTLETMCAIASKKTGKKIIRANICHETIPKADFYLCSGAMNTLHPYEAFLFIKNCFDASKEGFVFNILHGEKQSGIYNYLSTRRLEQIAKDLNVAKTVSQTGYLPNDITVMFYK